MSERTGATDDALEAAARAMLDYGYTMRGGQQIVLVIAAALVGPDQRIVEVDDLMRLWERFEPFTKGDDEFRERMKAAIG